MKSIRVVAGAVLLLIGIIMYFAFSFTIGGWIGIFVAIFGMIILVKPWDQGTPDKLK